MGSVQMGFFLGSIVEHWLGPDKSQCNMRLFVADCYRADIMSEPTGLKYYQIIGCFLPFGRRGQLEVFEA